MKNRSPVAGLPAGPTVRLMQSLKDDPARLAQFRHDYDELAGQ